MVAGNLRSRRETAGIAGRAVGTRRWRVVATTAALVAETLR
jgi:hypothetical protein